MVENGLRPMTLRQGSKLEQKPRQHAEGCGIRLWCEFSQPTGPEGTKSARRKWSWRRGVGVRAILGQLGSEVLSYTS